jgi:RNA polymerase primary sigma factor
VKAAEEFDAERGCRFSTYAVWWIKQAAQRAVAGEGRTIRVPVHRRESNDQIQTDSDVMV